MNSDPSGINQYGLELYPEDSVLREALLQYQSDGLKVSEQLIRLVEDFDLVIGLSTFKKLRANLKIPSTRREIYLEQLQARYTEEEEGYYAGEEEQGFIINDPREHRRREQEEEGD